jgi:hypothetical protein
LSNAGGRLIIASDGIWDALSSEAAAKSCRGLPAELAAKQVVKVNSLPLGYIFLFNLDDTSYGCQLLLLHQQTSTMMHQQVDYASYPSTFMQ